ncbi:DNA-binding protein [Bacteroidia bacterium]|nr:DNA-binding protein [Bacteroidia bacterium]
MKYRVEQKRNGINDKALYYAVPAGAGLIGTREIARELAGRCTLTPADIRATLIGLAEVMETYLHKGYSVKLDDLGVFRLSATSDGYATPEECTPHRVRAAKLCFRADPQIKKNLKYVKFERKNGRTEERVNE